MASRIGRWIVAIVCLLIVAGAAGAAPPEDVTYQGLLLDSAGDPLAGPVDIGIAIYSQPTGGFPLYTETHSGVTLVDGVFDVLIGTGTRTFGSFDAALFAAQNRYLDVMVDGEALQPRQPFSSVAYALRSGDSDSATYADTAGDADTVDGSHAASLDQSAHVSDTGNPHEVTAAQAGAASLADLAAHSGDAAAHHAKTTSFSELTDQAADFQIPDDITIDQAANADTVDGQHASFFASTSHLHDTRYYTEGEVNAIVANLQAQIDALTDLTQHLSRIGDDLYVTGANLHIVSGSGETDGAVTGLGNLIVGYNELRGSGDNRTGSHNIVVGREHNYSSYGGLVVGKSNSILGPFSSVSGGEFNSASGDHSSVSGGGTNAALAWRSSVSGGQGNIASGDRSSVSGGLYNEASSDSSSVSRGRDNSASGSMSSLSGGYDRSVSGLYDWGAGGYFQEQ